MVLPSSSTNSIDDALSFLFSRTNNNLYHQPRIIQICDSIETDGRFLLYSFAKQILSSSSSSSSSTASTPSGTWTSPSSTSSLSSAFSRKKNAPKIINKKGINLKSKSNSPNGSAVHHRSVFWLSFTSVTEQQIATGIKKYGCDVKPTLWNNSTSSSSTTTPAINVDNKKNTSLILRSVLQEFSTFLLSEENDDEIMTENMEELFLKQIYKSIKQYIAQELKNFQTKNNDKNGDDDNNDDKNNDCHHICWIFLDDISNLASVLGERVVHCFVDSLIAFAARSSNSSNNNTNTNVSQTIGIVIRNSIDRTLQFTNLYETEKTANSGNSMNASDSAGVGGQQAQTNQQQHGGWIGAGGMAHQLYSNPFLGSNVNDPVEAAALGTTLVHKLPFWETCLEEKVDVIIDVIPLLNGVSREAHGRLIVSTNPNKRWRARQLLQLQQQQQKQTHSTGNNNLTTTTSSSSSSSSSLKITDLVVNYCIHDTSVSVIKLHNINKNKR